jgi:hypothetical protein
MVGTCSKHGRKRNAYRVLVGKYHLEDPVVDGKIALLYIFRKWNGRLWTAFIWLYIGTSGGMLWTW